MENYPDLSKPLNNEMQYPDFSQPLDQLNTSPDISRSSELVSNLTNKAEQQAPEKGVSTFLDPLIGQLPNTSFKEFTKAPTKEDMQRGAGAMLGAIQPELNLGRGLLSHYVVNPLANMLSRIGIGTTSNMMMAAPSMKSKDQFKEMGKSALLNNALLEIPNALIRTPSYLAEIAYPNRLTRQTMNEIQHGYTNALQRQEQAYAPTHLYDEVHVTNLHNPADYLGLDNRDIRRLTTNGRRAYDDFIATPNYRNLHRFQYTVGNDAAKIANTPGKINTHQSLSAIRDRARERSRTFLERQSPEAVAAYDLGSHITQHEVAPFESNEHLRKIAEGRAEGGRSPIQVRQALRMGIEKKRSGRGENVVPTIPENHMLRHQHNRLNNAINLGMAARYGAPALATAIGAYGLNPSLGGAITGVGAGALGAGLGHLGVPGLSNVLTNPLMEQFLRKYVSPLYYGGGRIASGNALSK
jgi:hypothetical protein